MAETNLTALVRELWIRSLAKGFLLRMPILAKLLDQRRVSWVGGTSIKRTVDKADMNSLAQSYSANETLDTGRKTMLDTVSFQWKMTQLPIEYTIDEFLANNGAETNAAGEDFVKFIVKKGQRGLRIKMLEMMWAAGSSNRDGTTASDADWQSIPDALTHDITYGGKTRTDTTTNAWFQGASLAQDYADYSTNVPPSIDTVQQMIDAIRLNAESDEELLGVFGPSVFRQLKQQMQAQVLYRPGPLVKYGHDSMYIDNVEIVKDPWLESRAFNSSYATTKKYGTVLNTSDWEYRIHPQRAFAMPAFQWLGNFPGGRDAWLTRALVCGNLVCWRPTGSIFKSDVW